MRDEIKKTCNHFLLKVWLLEEQQDNIMLRPKPRLEQQVRIVVFISNFLKMHKITELNSTDKISKSTYGEPV